MEDAFGTDVKSPTSKKAAFSVTYGNSNLDEINSQIIEKMFDLISFPRGRKLASDTINGFMLDLLTTLAAHTLHAGLFFKHEAYSNEKEYRFLEVHSIDPTPQHKLRARPHSLIKYREFDWKDKAPSALRRIVIGPSADPQRAPTFVLDCLHEFRADNVQVAHSEIPYKASS